MMIKTKSNFNREPFFFYSDMFKVTLMRKKNIYIYKWRTASLIA